MANRFDDDKNCVAVWRFESADFTGDSKGNNDLVNIGVDVENVIIKEGAASAKFVHATADYMRIPDSSTDTGFPFRYTDGANTTKDITFCSWIRLVSLPSVTGSNYTLFDKYKATTNERCFSILIAQTTNKLIFKKGYNSGQNLEEVIYGTAFEIDKWYHVRIGYREFDKSYFISIYDDSAGAILGSEIMGNFNQTTTLVDLTYRVGKDNDAANSLDAYLDETVLWNVKKSLEDMDKVRQGTYNWKSFGNLSPNIQSLTIFTGGG